MKWYSELISNKYNSTGENQKKRGRKPVNEEIVREILRLAESTPSWGYDRITGVMKYLGYDVSATTVRNILDAHGIVPDPERRRRGDWLQFIETQQYVTAATDFAHVEMATEYGLEHLHLKQNQKYYAFEHKQRFFIALGFCLLLSPTEP